MRVWKTMDGCRFGLTALVLASACGSDPAAPSTTDQQTVPTQTAPGTGIGPVAGTGPAGTAGTMAARPGNSNVPVGAAGSSGAKAAAGGSTAPAGTGGAASPGGVAGASAAAGTSGAAGATAAGSGAIPTTGGTTPGVDQVVECDNSKAPAEFEAQPNVGGGGGQCEESPHFRVCGASGAEAMKAIDLLEGTYSCFVETLCWRSSGLSFNDDSDAGPYHKVNIYSVGSLGSAAGQMFSDAPTGMSYLRVISRSIADPRVIVHEYGHALTYHEGGWVEQTRTGAWWEPVANFVADTFMTSPFCAAAREQHNIAEGGTIIELRKVLGDSHQVLVDGSQGSGNYYQSWPFLAYLTYNPDGYAGLGKTALRDMFREHNGQNETPFHVLERVAKPTTVQAIVGRYWARMAYVDIGHKQAQEAFNKAPVTSANLDSAGGEMYSVKSARAPRYMGANIIPLSGSGAISVKVTSSGMFTATLAIRAQAGTVRYVDLPSGAGEATLESGEEASLVVANTPALLDYDPFSISGEAGRGLDYQVQLTGATPAN
jgi:hypothetical protein